MDDDTYMTQIVGNNAEDRYRAALAEGHEQFGDDAELLVTRGKRHPIADSGESIGTAQCEEELFIIKRRN